MGNQASVEKEDSLEGRDVRQLDQRVSAALAKGVKYNMKILIRGERGSGKTQFLRRLQNLEYDSKYVATPEITTAHMIWTHKGTEEHVKVELWDVVDKGIQPKAEWAGVTGKGGVEEKENAQEANVVLLDADTINVYQGCDGVMVLFDPWKRESFTYASKLAKEIKDELPVLLLANFADKADLIPPLPPSVTDKEIERACKLRERCYSLKVCCKDSFGLEEARDFLALPFLALKRRYAEKQLAQATDKVDETRARLDTYADTLNFAAHSAQWAAGGAERAKKQAAQLQAMQKGGKAAEEVTSPGGKCSKMVPIESLILPPQIDTNAPDLGKEVANFSTGALDENFFSSDDEVDRQVAVLGLESDEEGDGKIELLNDDDGEEAGKQGDERAAAPSAARKKEETEEEEGEDSDEEERKRVAAEIARKADERLRLEKMQAEVAAKQKAEEERLLAQMKDLGSGGLDPGFLSGSDEEEAAPAAAGKGKAAAQSASEDESKGKGSGSESESSEEEGGKPAIMADEDFSD